MGKVTRCSAPMHSEPGSGYCDGRQPLLQGSIPGPLSGGPGPLQQEGLELLWYFFGLDLLYGGWAH